MAPLRAEWEELREKLKAGLEEHDAEKSRKKRDLLSTPVKLAVESFRRRLAKVRVLDPACGSGNFLYVTLQRLLDLEDEIVRFCATHDIYVDGVPRIRPTQMHGIEINRYAAELAQVVIWIGYLQWLHEHSIDDPTRPILDKLQCIENRDAILDLRDKKNPAPAKWPGADFIIGNPPFLGSKLFRKSGLTDGYLRDLYCAFDIPRTSDLCCYWFELGGRSIARQPKTRVGLLATQGIRGDFNREVLSRICRKGAIFAAWSDRDWILDGASVHVSIIGFDAGQEKSRILDGTPVRQIYADLTADVDTVTARLLRENQNLGFMGDTKVGPFDIGWAEAAKMLRQPNSATKGNSDVVRPWVNGLDITRRPRAKWIIDFPPGTELEVAAKYEAPFAYADAHVRPMRKTARSGDATGVSWWIHQRPRPEMRARGIPPTICRYGQCDQASAVRVSVRARIA